MARFALETGLRRSNVTGLQWSQVDIVRRVAWIHPDQAKAKKAITVPLSDTAIAVLLRQRAKKKVPEFVDKCVRVPRPAGLSDRDRILA
ncbi:Site-specific recombinase, phage integrase family [Burkholderia cepacia]|nr:phage integrase family protein [Burkholderia cepacia ATCC 25416]SPU83689.1 Site-specific recombinase, phage integrase family [Burkholderia cepacia]